MDSAASAAPIGPAALVDVPVLPTVVLIGDSIRLGYAPLVARLLEGRARVVSPGPNGGDSANVLAHLDEWALRERPDVVHLNCGLHDLKRQPGGGAYQVPLDRYEANLREIVDRIRGGTDAALVFAATTPILDDRHAARGAGFDRRQRDVERYNAVALAVMGEAGVPVDDLHRVVQEGQGGPEGLLARDGTHYTPEGNGLLAAAVADCALRALAVHRYRHREPPPRGPAAAAAYQEEETTRDGAVPARFRALARSGGEFRPPPDAAAWETQRRSTLETVLGSLGDLPPLPSPPVARRVAFERRPGYTLERVAIDNGVDGEISALLLLPEGLTRPAPAVLWLHSSTPDKNQIVTPGTNGGDEPLGETLVRRGYAVLAPDAYWHGDRVGTGPAGGQETLRAEQESLHKLNLWLGRTLWGMFVRDDRIALDYLCRRPEVDAGRVGATGMSMGSTRAWWLAAVDERVAATVAMACLTRYRNLIDHGQLRAHGVYYFVHGLLRHFDVEGVLALIAPRPFLALTGELDAGSPADGIRELEGRVAPVYATLGAAGRYRSVLYPETGHTVTPEMRREALDWFDRWLGAERGERGERMEANG